MIVKFFFFQKKKNRRPTRSVKYLLHAQKLISNILLALFTSGSSHLLK